ncbi:DUF1311 domain-containing protein [Marinobacteraceae bacterium S3BR75-40.1]
MITRQGIYRSFVFLLLALSSVACQAVDNPEAPNYLESFRSEASTFEQSIYQEAQSTAEMVDAYQRYIQFLDKKLAATESAIEKELREPDRSTFITSQSAWESYRKAERDFISSVWTRKNFGSSSDVSRLSLYAHLLKSRIELLLKYRLQF